MVFHDAILSRSFRKSDQKKLGYGAMFCCLFIAFGICAALGSYLGPLPALTLRLATGPGADHKLLVMKETSASDQGQNLVTDSTIDSLVHRNVTRKIEPLCNVRDLRSDYCRLNGDIRIKANSSIVFIASSQMVLGKDLWKIRPYARKGDETAMGGIREWSILPAAVAPQIIPICTRTHSVPGVLFSVGGYAGYNFHAFTDIIIPLFLTTRHFKGEVRFLVTDNRSWWVRKFHAILGSLSKYEVIDIDKEGARNEIHCFPRVIVGLKHHHQELTIDTSRSPYSIRDFRALLRSAYSLKKESAIKLRGGELGRGPRLLIISRNRTRSFTNIADITTMAENLGYEVIASELDMNISRTAKIVNSCDVMMGVHGAGLTNFLFLPENGVLIQVVPLGKMGWHARTYFGDPARRTSIRYLEYQIMEQESTLVKEFPPDHLVLKDPTAFQKRGWNLFKSIYLEKQNVELDVNRFRDILVKALQLLHDA